ncbi:MAG: diaminopimelate epimerase [Propioniciclava sp.]
MVSFAKGHGTRNDFILLNDPDQERPLTSEDVRFLCDRRSGLGADGVLRAVRAAHVDGWEGDPTLWFMDYRNADGSIAEMCGNGLRVFARSLVQTGLIDPSQDRIEVGTRAGLRTAEFLPDQRIRVGMGCPRLGREVQISLAGTNELDAVAVDVGNPHAVVLLHPAQDLDSLDLRHRPRWDPSGAFPDGVNVEFVERVGDHRLRMRVFERGVGETQSCGTGTVAAVTAVAQAEDQDSGEWRVDVPGGSVAVELRDGEAWLTGPAVIVAYGEVALPSEERG